MKDLDKLGDIVKYQAHLDGSTPISWNIINVNAWNLEVEYWLEAFAVERNIRYRVHKQKIIQSSDIPKYFYTIANLLKTLLIAKGDESLISRGIVYPELEYLEEMKLIDWDYFYLYNLTMDDIQEIIEQHGDPRKL